MFVIFDGNRITKPTMYTTFTDRNLAIDQAKELSSATGGLVWVFYSKRAKSYAVTTKNRPGGDQVAHASFNKGEQVMKPVEYLYLLGAIIALAAFMFGAAHAFEVSQVAGRVAPSQFREQRQAVEDLENAAIQARCQAVADSLNSIGQ